MDEASRARTPHTAPLQKLRLRPAQAERLACYLDCLAEWSVRVNLTGARTPDERVRRLVVPVLALLDVVPAGTLIDVGAGNGSPGLVLALLRDDLEVTLLEPRARRWAFLREAARRARRPVRVLRTRHHAYAGPPARTVTMRALGLPLSELAPLVEPGGWLAVMGRRPALSTPFEAAPRARPLPGVWLFRRSESVSRETQR